MAVAKYLGNKAGADALISEYVCAILGNMIGIETPEFAIIKVKDLKINADVDVQDGPVFLSKFINGAYELSPTLLRKIRDPRQVTRLVVFDTWIRNSDRYYEDNDLGILINKPENALLVNDKRKLRLLAIDHSHALCDESLEDGLGQAWVDEAKIYGLFPMYVPFLDRSVAKEVVALIGTIDEASVRRICQRVPREWGMGQSLTKKLAKCLTERGARLADWLVDAMFDQYELELGGGRHDHE